jgi:hypothetical protein
MLLILGAVLIFGCVLLFLTTQSSAKYTFEPKISGELPPILVISVHMGIITREFIRLTLESMKFNSKIDFAIYNILDDADPQSHENKRIPKLIKKIGAHNVHYKVLTYGEFSTRVQQRLGIQVSFNQTWYYKVCDYKPTFGLLFPELFERRIRKHHTPYKFWGYGDIDLIWGNSNHFAHLFQGNYVVIRSGERNRII